MSEAEFLAFSRERARLSGPQASRVAIALSDEESFTRQGALDFVDNAVNRSSGTIRARATVPNPDLFLTPGAFARLRLAMTPPAPTLLVPDAAVLLDQSQRIVMTVASDGTVVPKPVEIGDLRGGLRVIRSGLAPADRVIIDGIVRAMPGGRVTPQDGTISYRATPDDGNS
jgi:RND family efflux transporter MFP subunit